MLALRCWYGTDYRSNATQQPRSTITRRVETWSTVHDLELSQRSIADVACKHEGWAWFLLVGYACVQAGVCELYVTG